MREGPELVLSQSGVIRNHKELGSSHRSASNVLGDKEELEIVEDNITGNNGTRTRVRLSIQEKPIINPLIHSNLRKLGVVVLSK